MCVIVCLFSIQAEHFHSISTELTAFLSQTLADLDSLSSPTADLSSDPERAAGSLGEGEEREAELVGALERLGALSRALEQREGTLGAACGAADEILGRGCEPHSGTAVRQQRAALSAFWARVSGNTQFGMCIM